MVTAGERTPWNDLKFGTAGEVNSKEGVAHAEGLRAARPNCSYIEAPQVEINIAIGEAHITKPVPQLRRTKLIFDVRIDDPFLD